MTKVQIHFIKQSLEDPEPLTDWECDFIANLADKDETYIISDKQNKILNRISQKYL